MKIKSIMLYGALLLLGGAATTSCEDMFTVDNNLVTTNLAPQDTVYQMMGIVQRMQKLADRTVLLGEVRADLVTVDEAHAPLAIQELGRNEVSADNVFNQPKDYYDVINACNIYLTYVDSLRGYLQTQNYYDKEILAAKCFRAWCYLELIKVYGDVPYTTEPIVTPEAAEQLATGTKTDKVTVLTGCIDDIVSFLDGGADRWRSNQSFLPSYGSKWQDISFSNFFIPYRVMLAELYLWRASCTQSRADYIEAIRMYHDFFTFPGEERGVTTNYAYWYDRNFSNNRNSTYQSNFRLANTTENVTVLPLDTISYFGNVSDIDIRSVFNSQYSNGYYPAVTPSERLKTISRLQQYCSNNILQGKDTTYTSNHSTGEYADPLQEGDLRLSSVYVTSSRSSENQTTGASFNTTSSFCAKWVNGSLRGLTTDERGLYIPLFRITHLYLHMAEALNRAGFPATAWLVLSKGIDFNNMQWLRYYYPNEFDGLCSIKSKGFDVSETYYRTYYADDEEGDALYNSTASSFAVWDYNRFRHRYKIPDGSSSSSWTYFYLNVYSSLLTGNSYLMQAGIHSLGSGDTECNQYYLAYGDDVIAGLENLNYEDVPELGEEPTEEELAANSAAVERNLELYIDYLASDDVVKKMQARIARMILDEEALEGMFEGTRFYDLMRYQLQEGQFGSTITLPSYISTTYDSDGGANMVGKPWYLTLPAR